MKSVKKELLSKMCAVCGLEMEWRKKWEKVWDEVKYCSDRCRTEIKRYGEEMFEMECALLKVIQPRSTVNEVIDRIRLLKLKSGWETSRVRILQGVLRLKNTGRVRVQGKGKGQLTGKEKVETVRQGGAN